MKNLDFKSMLIGFLLCVVAFLSIGATGLGEGIRNKNGVLYVRGIVVTGDPSGEPELDGNSISINPKRISLYDSDFHNLIMPHSIMLLKGTQQAVNLATTTDGIGMINTYNKFGNIASSLAVTENQDGGVFLYDRYGDFGNSVVGKK
tara:strand:- start:1716 stop:2156 length:441 start_codon:yes stop_codon:yes gene_type:complete